MLLFRLFLKILLSSKQKILVISSIGLILSSFSLLFLQSIMSGLQNGVIMRSKNILGSYILQTSEDLVFSEKHYKEKEIEVILEKDVVTPIILHGYYQAPDFLKNLNTKDLILGVDLSSILKISYQDKIHVLAPQLPNFFLPNLPRFFTTEVSDYLFSDVQSLDYFHGWIQAEILESSFFEADYIYRFFEKPKNVKNLISWEDQNQELVWALSLERNTMLFLFSSMSLLISISIGIAFAMFFQKIKQEIITFYILGSTLSSIYRTLFQFGLLFTSTMIATGIGISYLLLRLLQSKISLPMIFLEKTLPILITSEALIKSFLIPFCITYIFYYYIYSSFKKESSDILIFFQKS
jgi:lipoprotein-releasing system permease protein